MCSGSSDILMRSLIALRANSWSLVPFAAASSNSRTWSSLSSDQLTHAGLLAPNLACVPSRSECLLKRTEDFLFVGRVDESAERIHRCPIDIVRLVRSDGRRSARLDLQHRPPVTVQNREIRYSLAVARIILQDHTTREHVVELGDEFLLKLRLKQGLFCPFYYKRR